MSPSCFRNKTIRNIRPRPIAKFGSAEFGRIFLVQIFGVVGLATTGCIMEIIVIKWSRSNYPGLICFEILCIHEQFLAGGRFVLAPPIRNQISFGAILLS
jgi:hypothetical protein